MLDMRTKTVYIVRVEIFKEDFMQAEKLKREQVSVMLHPDIIIRVDLEREKKIWNRSQFIEWALIKTLEKLEK